MALSAVATTTVEQAQPRSTVKLDFGNYKEIDPYDVNKDVETGKVGGNGAKVRQRKPIYMYQIESRVPSPESWVLGPEY